MTVSYVALLRAVNVGGTTLKMDRLREIVRSLGFEGVTTYIQSGNVVFKYRRTEPAALARQIEDGLAHKAGISTTVLVRTHDELSTLAAKNPFIRKRRDPAKLHVTFLAKPAVDQLAVPDGWPEEASVAGCEVYLFYPEGYGRSKLSNAYIEKRLGVPATTRNWATVLKLRDLSAP